MNRDGDLFAIPGELHGQMAASRDWTREDLDRYTCCQQPRQRRKEVDSSCCPHAREGETCAFSASLHLVGTVGTWPVTRSSLVIADHESGELREVVSWYREGRQIGWSSIGIGIGIVDPATGGEGTICEARGLWICQLLTTVPTIVHLDPGTWSGNRATMRLGEKNGFVENARFRRAMIADGHPCDDLEGWIVGSGWRTGYPDGFAPLCS